MTETTKLETVDDVKAAIDAIAYGAPVPKKKIERQLRASRLADLYEIRAHMWAILGAAADGSDTIPDAYRAACVVAEARDWDLVKFWRTEAGAR